MNVQKLVEFIRLAEYAIQVAESKADWEVKYNVIFSEDVSKRLLELSDFDWCDPDGSYEADVTAFIEALGDHLAEIRKIASAVLESQIVGHNRAPLLGG